MKAQKAYVMEVSQFGSFMGALSSSFFYDGNGKIKDGEFVVGSLLLSSGFPKYVIISEPKNEDQRVSVSKLVAIADKI